MLQLARGITHMEEFREKLRSIEPLVPRDVVRFRYTFDNDWTGDPAVFFWVIITDEAAKRLALRDVTVPFQQLIEENVDPLNEWGLFAYFSFRSVSEQAKLKGKEFD